MERSPKHEIKNVEVTRRGFLRRAGATFVASTLIPTGLNYQDDEPLIINTEKEPVSSEEVYEQYNEQSDSGYFMEDVRRYAEEFSVEVDEVLENVDMYCAIEEYFILPNIKHEILRKNLEALAPALGFVESRYKNAKSEVGAFGVMQLMPGTWEELSRDDDDKDDVVVQIKVAARLMEQSYRHVMSSCKTELDQIKQEFFGGDTEAFETACLTPIFLNSYNAGMGSMEILIKEFVKLCPTPADTVELFEQSETLTGYDVFIGMAHTGNARGWADWYKDVAANYTCKVYGAHTAVADYFKQQNEVAD